MRLTYFLSFFLSVVGAIAQSLPTNVADINPFIGTGGHGHTHPSAQAPFGMMQLGPNTRYDGWDGCSGYHYTDSVLLGFSTTHLSGTGVSDYGDFLFRPSRPDGSSLHMLKSTEKASAAYYYVELNQGEKLCATAGDRVGILRIIYPAGRPKTIELDLSHRDHVTLGLLAEAPHPNASENGAWQATRHSKAWATNQKAHLAFTANQPASTKEVEDLIWEFEFLGSSDTVELYLALSGTDTDGAWTNYNSEFTEVPSFDTLHQKSLEQWEQELGKSIVYHSDSDWRSIYATALYHAYSVPNLWSDADGRYRGMDDQIHTDTSNRHYTIFSLWDTYRTAHPLYAITQPKRTREFLNGMLDMHDQYGRLPVWELAANETNCMIGYHSVSVIADALAKGYPIDTARAVKAMVETAEADSYGLEAYRKYGFLSIEDESESVSKTLEYAYDDACISWAMERLGKPELALHFNQRATGYRSLLDPKTGWMRPRSNGSFLTPFDPRQVNNHYTEANSYQYSFAPVQDIDAWKKSLAEYLGFASGEAALFHQLEALFTAPSETTGRDQSDITGLIGQYAHGNEPSHHIAYLYNATDSVHKTQARVWEIMEKFYQNAPDGLSGNEDCGQMSAWFVMASWGMYPLVPGTDKYALSTPFWDRLELQFPSGKKLTLIAEGDGPYIRSWAKNPSMDRAKAEASTVENDRTWFTHDQLNEGGLWHVERSSSPTSFGRLELYRTSLNNSTPPAPEILVPRTYSGKVKAEVIGLTAGSVRVAAEGAKVKYKKDRAVVLIKENTRIEASVVHFGTGKHIAYADVQKQNDQFTASWEEGVPNSQYTAGGPKSMVDGITGEVDWRKGHWVGIQGSDAELRIQSHRAVEAQTIKVGLLKDIGAWIALPKSVSVYSRPNEKSEWVLWKRVDLSEEALLDSAPERRDISFEAPGSVPVLLNEIKIVYENAGFLQDWHPGAGGESFFFTDEIDVLLK